MATVNGFVAFTLCEESIFVIVAIIVPLLSLSLQFKMLSIDFVLLFIAEAISLSTIDVASDTWNGFVGLVVTDIGDVVFKNGFVDTFAVIVVVVVGAAADSGVVTLLDSFALNSALNIFNDGTLIFSIVPRFSEKCVTVTVSLVAVGVVVVVDFPFCVIEFLSISCNRSNGNMVDISD